MHPRLSQPSCLHQACPPPPTTSVLTVPDHPLQAGSRGEETAYLRARTVEIRHSSEAIRARTELDIVQSSDNASFWKMTAPGLGLTERVMLCSWTALGEWHLDPRGGCDAAGKEYSRSVGHFLAPAGSKLPGIVAVTRKAGAVVCTHPGMHLPKDPALLAALLPFDGTATHAAVLYPEAVNLSDSPTMLTWVSETKELELQCLEQLASTCEILSFSFGALNDVSSPLLPRRLRRFGQLPAGGDPGGHTVGPPEGALGFSRRVHAPQWNPALTQLRSAKIRPTAPVAEDSLSHTGQAAVVMEEFLRHEQCWPGFFNRLPGGDSNRIAHQGDVGTERVTIGLLRKARTAVQLALLDESDARSVKFESVAVAKSSVEFLSMLTVPDHLHAPLHNGMALIKGFLVAHWKVASLDQIKTLFGFSGIRPSKEGESYRLKKRLLRIYSLAYIQVLMRHFHTTPSLIGRVKKLDDGYTLDEDDYWKKVRSAQIAPPDPRDPACCPSLILPRNTPHPQFRTMVECSNVDGELKVLNHFVLDLLVPFSLEQWARGCGFGELQVSLKKYWLAYLAESNCPNVSHHMLRCIYSYMARSPRRNALVLHNASPSLRGTFGRSLELDALQARCCSPSPTEAL